MKYRRVVAEPKGAARHSPRTATVKGQLRLMDARQPGRRSRSQATDITQAASRYSTVSYLQAARSFPLAALFEREASRCHADTDLFCLIEATARELGFDYFALVHHASLAPCPSAPIRLHNYPDTWERELIGEGLAPHDPVHQASQRTNAGFSWSQLGALLSLSARQRGILERSARHGIGEGFTVPGNVPGEPVGSASFAVRHGRALPQGSLLDAQLVGVQAFAAARRIHGYPARGRRPHLSPRQLQCLRLLAAGKTDWEMARILGLSAETTRQYVKSARAVYDVVSRTQLVVHALRDGRIGFDESIPPSGGMG